VSSRGPHDEKATTPLPSRSVIDEVTELRRHFHRHPEVSFSEHETSRQLGERLRQLGLELKPCPTETGVVALLDTGKPGKTVMLRADIDGLPIHEESGVDFASRADGRMHACGHDAHMAIMVGVARTLVDRADLASELDALQEAAEAALDELRTLARGIYPSSLRDHGPAAALRALAQRSAVPIRVIDEGIGRAPAAVEATIYFCAREAIQNATKHAGPGASVTATLTRQRGAIDLTISDNGVGISPNAVSNGIGIRGMHDRIEAVGGRLDIFSEPGLGTCIRGTIPHEEAPLAARRADASIEAGVALAC